MGNLRVVVIIEHPTDKRLHVSQRAIDKKRYPGLFNLGVESAIDSGEAYIEAGQRRLREVGITPQGPTLSNPLFEFVFNNGKYSGRQVVYHEKHPYLINPGKEFQWKGWMTKEEIDDLYTKSRLCPDTSVIYERFREEFYGKI